MQVSKLIIHEIEKSENEDPKKVSISSKGIVINDKAKTLVTELNKRYGKLPETYGAFDNTLINSFPDFFSAYLKSLTDDEFTNLTTLAVNRLYQDLFKVKKAKGGYLVFAEFQFHGDFIGIYLIRNKKGNIFKTDSQTGDFYIDDTIHLDYDNLAMASRINKSNYIDQENSYLSFINKKNVDSNYFTSWIGATELTQNKVYSENLYTILQSMPIPLNEDNSPRNKIEFIRDVSNHIKQENKEISIKEIGEKFYSNADAISDYANLNNIKINTSFKADQSVLRKFSDIKVTADKIDIKFPQNYLTNGIVDILEGGNELIIKSKSLIDKILKDKI